jgi:hypothetical protein
VISRNSTCINCVRLVFVMSVVTVCANRLCPAQSAQRTHRGTAPDNHALPENPMERAGNPLCISPLARCFPGPKYKGYSVGGGAAWYGSPATAIRGEGRFVNEGTFGVDYAPWYSRVQMRWFHGRKQQGGEGQYEPDGYNNPLDEHLSFGRFRKAPRRFQY